jgi:hypothetical protein
MLRPGDVLHFSLPVQYSPRIDLLSADLGLRVLDFSNSFVTTLYSDNSPGILTTTQSNWVYEGGMYASLLWLPDVAYQSPWPLGAVNLHQFNDGLGADRISGAVRVNGGTVDVTWLTIGFYTANGRGGLDWQKYSVSDFTVDPVPEPSSLVLLGIGLAAVVRRRRK